MACSDADFIRRRKGDHCTERHKAMSLDKSMQSFSVDGASVVVVGGGSGIGKAIATASAAHGADVTIASRNEEKLKAAAAESGDRVQFLSVDMTDEASVANWGQHLPSFDHLVISASSAAHGPFETVEMDALRNMFDAKFFGPYLVARAALPKIRNGGSITFFAGVLSRRPGKNCSGLGAVNGAIEALTRGLALELGPRVRVNCCSPGMVRSDAYSAMDDAAREEMYRSTGASLPMGRVGFPNEIAHAVFHMMTNTYLTGQVLDIDGGHMIRQYAQG